MKILIVGTGALATLFGARLACAGCEVTLLGSWRQGLEALNNKGAAIVDSNRREQSFKLIVSDDPKALHGVTHAIVLVKSWQTERAALQLQQCLAPEGLALTLQNGIGNQEILAEKLGAGRVALGTTTSGATLIGPGRVRAGGEGMTSVEAHPATGPIAVALRSANFNVEIVRDAVALVWGKLVINAAINPLTAILRVSNGELLKSPAARELLNDLAEEAAQVALAENVKLPFSDPGAAAVEVAEKTAANYSSMFQDIRRGAPTEIDAICGAVVRIGKLHNIPTPVNETCWHLVKALVHSSERPLSLEE